MRSPLAALAVLAVFAAVAGRAAEKGEYVYVGASALGGPAPTAVATEQLGIYVLRLDPKTGQLSTPALSVQLQRATAFAVHPTLPILYSVADGSGPQSDSELYSFRSDRATGQLIVINHVDSGGHDATALALDAASQTLFAAHYGSGTLGAVSVNANGSLGAVASSQSDTGSGPSPRQKSAHAHDVALAPGGRYALVTDLGADRIFVYPFDAPTRTLSAGEGVAEALPPGSGPRHLVFSRDGKYLLVNTELTTELRSYRWDPKAGRLSAVQSIQTYPAGQNGDKSSSELALSTDGHFAYLALRGDQDSLIVYAFNPHKGTLREIQRISSGGKAPWSFGIDPTGRWLLVTNEGSNAVVEMKIDRATGKLSTTGHSVAIPQPVAVAFLAR
jgi:6-phosphogluconolactonase